MLDGYGGLVAQQQTAVSGRALCLKHRTVVVKTTKSLGEAEKIYAKWRSMLKDQWDIRDLTTGWDGYPWCNSHYARQLILWTIPLALSGQRYSAPGRALSFEPRVAEPAALPFFTPTAHGILELVEGRSPRLRILAGTLEVEAPVVVRSTGVEIEIIATDQKG